jgi:hypothetical protein
MTPMPMRSSKAEREARAAAFEEAAQYHDRCAAKAAVRANESFVAGRERAQALELTEVRVHEASAADLRGAAKIADPLRARGLPEDVRRLSEKIRALPDTVPQEKSDG